MENHEELIEQVKAHVRNDRTEKALALLSEAELSSTLENRLDLLISRFNRVKEEQSKDIISGENANREKNRINDSLLGLCDDIEAPSLNPHQEAEPIYEPVPEPIPEPIPVQVNKPAQNKKNRLLIYIAIVLVLCSTIIFSAWKFFSRTSDLCLFVDHKTNAISECISFPVTMTLDDLKKSILQDYEQVTDAATNQWVLIVNRDTLVDLSNTETLEVDDRIQDKDTVSVYFKEKAPDKTPITPPSAPPNDYSIHGFLIDASNDSIVDEYVYLEGGEKQLKVLTESNGYYKFKGLEKGIEYQLLYNNEVVGIDKTKVADTLKIVKVDLRPEIKRKFTLCNNVVDRNPDKIIDTEDGRGTVLLKSMSRDTAGNRIIYCHFTSWCKEEKTLPLYFKWIWYKDGCENKCFETVERPNQFSKSGWRSWATKKIFHLGQWTLEISEKPDEVPIKTIEFDIKDN